MVLVNGSFGHVPLHFFFTQWHERPVRTLSKQSLYPGVTETLYPLLLLTRTLTHNSEERDCRVQVTRFKSRSTLLRTLRLKAAASRLISMQEGGNSLGMSALSSNSSTLGGVQVVV